MKNTLLLIAAAVLLSSCGTLFSSRKQELAFDSNVKGVDIYINGEKACSTPCIALVERSDKTLMIRAEKAGYSERTVFVEHGYNPVAVLNVLSHVTSTFGLSTDYTSNRLWQYAPGSFYVSLHKEPRSDAERRFYEKADRLRDFVLKNYAQLQVENFDNGAVNREYTEAAAQMSGAAAVEIRSAVLQSLSESECAERIVEIYLRRK